MQLIDPFSGKYDAGDLFGSLGYGRKNGHTGSDWIVPAGSSVPAIGDGVVVAGGWHDGNGNYVCVKLEDGHHFAYLHLQAAASVNVGERITRGQIIAKSGNSGTNSQGAHLHITISDSIQAYVGLGNKVDPFGFITARLNGASPRWPPPRRPVRVAPTLSASPTPPASSVCSAHCTSTSARSTTTSALVPGPRSHGSSGATGGTSATTSSAPTCGRRSRADMEARNRGRIAETAAEYARVVKLNGTHPEDVEPWPDLEKTIPRHQLNHETETA